MLDLMRSKSGEAMRLHVSTDKALLDVPLIHGFLNQHSTWAKGIPMSVVEASIEHSLCFGGYLGREQIAFARVVSDFAASAIAGSAAVHLSDCGCARVVCTVWFQSADVSRDVHGEI